MNWPNTHVLINHFPIILTIMGAAAVVVALLLRSRKVWLYGVASLTLAGLTAYPAVWTGTRAEEALEHAWYVQERAIHTHEEAAELTMWILLAMGAVAAFAWWRTERADERTLPGGRRPPPLWLRVVVLLFALAGAGTVTWTSLLGGRIIHESPIIRGPRPAGVPAPVERARPGATAPSGAAPAPSGAAQPGAAP
ncbi:MAG TPA: hypothetical protein VFQ38_09180 [Longimicrobiales bacterium]|nr:hypothetical protein [Longimicrobiales bacterium]